MNAAKKRIFGSKRRYEETIKPAALEQQQAEPAPLKYAPTYEPPRFLANGWSPPPPPDAQASLPCAQTPFQVERAGPGQWLPVYTDVRKGRTQLVTLVRKVSGDLEVRGWVGGVHPFESGVVWLFSLCVYVCVCIFAVPRHRPAFAFIRHTQQEMAAEMSKVCGNKEVRIGTGPRLEVKGRFTRELRGWLAGLGF